MTEETGVSEVVVPREPTPEMLEPFARVLCSAATQALAQPAPHSGGAWIEWSGGENPVPGRDVVVRFRDGDESEPLDSRSFDWSVPFLSGVPQCDIIAYRVVAPHSDGLRALADAADRGEIALFTMPAKKSPAPTSTAPEMED